MPPEDGVALWRYELMGLFQQQLFFAPTQAGTDTTYADWIGCKVDLHGEIRDPEQFESFWYSDVSKSDVPRNWLRWALHWAQMKQRISPGNPSDTQHGSFILDCDLFITGDKALCQVLGTVSGQVPASTAEVLQFRPSDSSDAADQLRQLIRSS